MNVEQVEVWASAAPWAMQLALRDDRPDRPSHLAVCEAAAAAVVLLLTDPRSTEPDGEWAKRVRHWESGPIRKVVRRGRGVRFTEVQELPGVSVLRRDTCVRAFVPGPTDQVPPALAKLQVGGTDQPERGEPSAAEPGALSIALTPLSPMTTGKAAAQSGHAAQLALRGMPAAALQAWQDSGWAVRVLTPEPASWSQLTKVAPVAVHDGGFTEVAPGTRTALAWWSELS
ncbi:MAG TPA: peptidyl-tRNA hydrolase [Kineosporiaceae bacterium]|nr:peptidyl-tRNA hydrolase [Kineosporiaceae bacterium]